MKLPRYQKGTFSQGAGSRSLTAGLQQGPSAGQQIAKTVQNFIQQKIEFDVKMNEIQFKTNSKQYNAEVGDSMLSFITDIETRDDTENFDPEYNSLVTQLTSGAKQKFGDGFERYQGDFQQAILLGRSNYEKVKRKKIIAVAQNTSLKDDSTWNTNIFNFKNPLLISQEYEIRRKLIEDEGGEGLFTPTETKQRLDSSRQAANNATIQKQIGNFGDLDGQLRNLQNRDFKIFDVNGVELSLNHPLRQAMISEKIATNKSNQQYAEELTARQQNKEIEYFQGLVNEHLYKEPNPQLPKQILNSGLKEEVKKNFLEQIKKEKEDLSETRKGKNINRFVDVLIESGMIDTDTEIYQFITKYHLAEEGSYFGGTEYENKMKRIQQLRDRTTAYKNEVMEEALGAISAQIGADQGSIFQKILLARTKGTQGKKEAQDMFMNSIINKTPEEQEKDLLAFEAANNLRNLISIGEKNGLTIESMVQDISSDNYIVNKVISSYLQKEKNITADYLKNRSNDMVDQVRVFGINPKDFKRDIEQGTLYPAGYGMPQQNIQLKDIEMPPMENLTPIQYMEKYPQYFFGKPPTSGFNPTFKTKETPTN